GAGTLREERGGMWTPEQPFPDAAGGFAELRRAMHASERPLMVVVSASGDLDLKTPALAEGAPVVILTTRAGAKCLAGAPTHLRIRALERTTAAEILKATVDETGGKLILTEGGPTLLGHFLRERSLDDLFLTIAPRIVGRDATARRVPRALDLAPIRADPCAFVQRSAGVRAGIAHRVDLVVKLHDEDRETGLCLPNDRLAILEARLVDVEALPLRRRLRPGLAVH